jgi:hypothetical protein
MGAAVGGWCATLALRRVREGLLTHAPALTVDVLPRVHLLACTPHNVDDAALVVVVHVRDLLLRAAQHPHHTLCTSQHTRMHVCASMAFGHARPCTVAIQTPRAGKCTNACGQKRRPRQQQGTQASQHGQPPIAGQRAALVSALQQPERAGTPTRGWAQWRAMACLQAWSLTVKF